MVRYRAWCGTVSFYVIKDFGLYKRKCEKEDFHGCIGRNRAGECFSFF